MDGVARALGDGRHGAGDVGTAAAAGDRWSRNTVLTYLTRMEGKGLVAIDKTLTPHQYRAVPDQESCREQERKSFVERVYSGATGDLIAAFLKEEKITPAERERLRRLLDEMEV